MSQYARKRTIPLIGAVTGPMSLSLVAHGVLLVLLIVLTIERRKQPAQLTDTPDNGTVIALAGVRPDAPAKKPAPPVAAIEPAKPDSAPDEKLIEEPVEKMEKPVPVVVAPTPAPQQETPAGFEASQKIDAAPARPPEQKRIGNPAPRRLDPNQKPLVEPNAGSGGDIPGVPHVAPGQGVAAFTSVLGDQARSIVYVIDASGAMTSCLPFIREELQRSIMRLDATQQFQVVVCREYPEGVAGPEPAVFTFAPRADLESSLVPATDLNKSLIRSWGERVEPLGRSRIVVGLERALELKPDLIFLLSRSVKRTGVNLAGTQDAVLSRLDQLNPQSASGKRRTVIKALHFIEDDSSGLLQRIAQEHGDGPQSYRVISVPEPK